MRIEKLTCKRYDTARRKAPWAAVIAPTRGGFIAFESLKEYQMWSGQR